MVYQAAEDRSTESGDKIDDGQKAEIEDVLKGAKEDLASDDRAKMDAARQRVEQAMHKVAEVLYQAQGDPGAAGGAPGADPGAAASETANDDDVIDAEFTEEK